MEQKSDLLDNLEKLHTTELGAIRIKRNLTLNTENVVEWCKLKIQSPQSSITRKGKNWYVQIEDCVITVNVYSYTIITAHRKKIY